MKGDVTESEDSVESSKINNSKAAAERGDS